MTRRRALSLATAGLGLLLPAVSRAQAQTGAKTRIDIYKDPSCGCCHKWVEHMAANGFDTRVVDGDTRPIKTKYGIPTKLQSCHTGIVQGVVIEGHVPAADVRKFLAARPAGAVGLTIPGMPQSAPGMDLTPFQPYTVLSFDKQGNTKVFAQHDKA
jgi:hypothetical protein